MKRLSLSLLATALSIALTSVAQAQAQKPVTADFVLQVPLSLANIPGEVHTVVVWCDVLNANYVPQEGVPLTFRGEPRVIASTGSVKLEIFSERDRRARAAGTQPASKPAPPWALTRIDSINAVTGRPLLPADLSRISYPLTYSTRIISGSTPPSPPPVLIMTASTLGATNPALGTAYQCNLGFQASAMVDGKMTDFNIFDGAPGSYDALPTMTPTTPNGPPPREPEKVLRVYGATGPASKP